MFTYRYPALLLLILLLGCTSKSTNDLTVAAAANMQFAIEELITAFSEMTGKKVHLVTSSSGKLTAQIKEGAPYDIMVSADLKYPYEIFKMGLAVDTPKVYARGQLALWSTLPDWPVDLAKLTEPEVAHIAVANPRTAPYGLAALHTIERLGILEAVRGKLVYGESVSQTNQFIITGAAEIGFTALSVLQSPQMAGTQNWQLVDTALYDPILQGVVILNNSAHLETARAFYDFLFTPSAKDILNKYGYITD